MFSQIGLVSTFLTVNPPDMRYQERHAGRTGGKSQTCGFQKTEHFIGWWWSELFLSGKSDVFLALGHPVFNLSEKIIMSRPIGMQIWVRTEKSAPCW